MKRQDLSGKQFGQWKVIRYIGNKQWECQCLNCGNLYNVAAYKLTSGKSKSCGCKTTKFKDISGETIGEWTVLYRIDTLRYMCRCSCGVEKPVQAYHLKHNQSKSCGHNTNKLINLHNKRFGFLVAIEYAGNKKWKCQCDCGIIKNISTQSLLTGEAQSCGCKTNLLSREKLLSKYGDPVPSRARTPREKWQIDILESRDKFKEFIKNHDDKPTIYQLADELNVTHSTILHRLDRYNIKHLVNINPYFSEIEKEVYKYIRSIYNGNIITRDKKILHGNELDIYIPEKKLAIEINGSYWHNELHKTKDYHQNKTIACAKQGIHIIHIFEHEWINKELKQKIKWILDSNIKSNLIFINEVDICVKNIELNDANIFLEKYSIESKCNAPINIGAYYNNELVGVISLYNNTEYQYEILRICYKDNIQHVSILNKLFEYFVNTYKPQSISVCVNITKFTGNSLTKLGFKATHDAITEPDYVWVNTSNLTNIITSDNENNSSDDIMRYMKYNKVFDSGKIKLTWINSKTVETQVPTKT